MAIINEFGDKVAVGQVNPKFFKNTACFGFKVGLDTTMIGQEFSLCRLGKVKFVGMYSPMFAIVEAADGRLFKYDPEVVAKMIKG